MTKPEQAGVREKLAAIEFWQGTDGDPEFPEDVYGGLPEDVIETLLALIESTCMEVIGNSDLAIENMPGLTNDNMARNGLRQEQRQALSKLLGRGEDASDE